MPNRASKAMLEPSNVGAFFWVAASFGRPWARRFSSAGFLTRQPLVPDGHAMREQQLPTWLHPILGSTVARVHSSPALQW